MAPRSPVVVVLGHVDHGKTTLLDTIRKTNVAGRESGGITQHVGAYVVERGGKTITFLDTPGHEAFSAMRSRGAQVADVAILVVAVDDGVKPQTKEAIEAIRSSHIPFVVAMNKIDKGNADIERTKNGLTEAGVLLEGWGGDTPNVEISAKAGSGVDELLELVLLVAEVAELGADPTGMAEGAVIEAHRDSRRGPVATLLVKEGTLRRGDAIVAGSVFGRAKAIEDFAGKNAEALGPSMPAVVLGFNEVPAVGDAFSVFPDDAMAAEKAQSEAKRRAREQVIAEGSPEGAFSLIVKADVMGSLEAVMGELGKFRNSFIAIRVAAADTGDITENEVKQAAAIGAIVVGFRVKAPRAIQQLAERTGVSVVTFPVIYEMLDFLRKAIEERMPRKIIREDMGVLQLLATFRSDPPRQVIGGRITKGSARKGLHFELERNNAIVGSGEVLEAQMNKIVVDEVPQGNECGTLVKFRAGGPAKEGDTLRLFTERIEQQKLG